MNIFGRERPKYINIIKNKKMAKSNNGLSVWSIICGYAKENKWQITKLSIISLWYPIATLTITPALLGKLTRSFTDGNVKKMTIYLTILIVLNVITIMVNIIDQYESEVFAVDIAAFTKRRLINSFFTTHQIGTSSALDSEISFNIRIFSTATNLVIDMYRSYLAPLFIALVMESLYLLIFVDWVLGVISGGIMISTFSALWRASHHNFKSANSAVIANQAIYSAIDEIVAMFDTIITTIGARETEDERIKYLANVKREFRKKTVRDVIKFSFPHNIAVVILSCVYGYHMYRKYIKPLMSKPIGNARKLDGDSLDRAVTSASMFFAILSSVRGLLLMTYMVSDYSAKLRVSRRNFLRSSGSTIPTGVISALNISSKQLTYSRNSKHLIMRKLNNILTNQHLDEPTLNLIVSQINHENGTTFNLDGPLMRSNISQLVSLALSPSGGLSVAVRKTIASKIIELENQKLIQSDELANLIAEIFKHLTSSLPMQKFIRSLFKTTNSSEIGHISNVDEFNHVIFDKITFKYSSNGPKIFNSTSFSIPMGKKTALLGPNGCGKSTILRLLMRFVIPEQGDVRIRGKSLLTMDPAVSRLKIICAVQTPMLFERSVLENIIYPRKSSSEMYRAVVEFIKSVGVFEYISKLPQGLDTFVGKRGERLSGGQRQVVQILRILYKSHQSDIILLDEVSSAVDISTRNIITTIIKAFPPDKTVILVTHDPEVAKICDNQINVVELTSRRR